MTTLESPIAAALNHLLDTEAWARARLVPFAGDTVEFALPPLPALRLGIESDGRLRPAARVGAPSLLVRLGPEAGAAFLRGEDHFMRAIDVSGNAKLAAEVLVLVRHLRWDVEEDLSRVVGDIAAHRLVGWGRSFTAWQRDAIAQLADSAMEYALEERRMLVSRDEFEAHVSAVAQLRDAIARFEQRLRRMG
jgi:ubiquinone biosynthesis accessory factor UbiJ